MNFQRHIKTNNNNKKFVEKKKKNIILAYVYISQILRHEQKKKPKNISLKRFYLIILLLCTGTANSVHTTVNWRKIHKNKRIFFFLTNKLCRGSFFVSFLFFLSYYRMSIARRLFNPYHTQCTELHYKYSNTVRCCYTFNLFLFFLFFFLFLRFDFNFV